MKSLDKYISEAGGFFGNTKTSKTDLVMDWIKTYMPSVLKNPDSIKIDDKGITSIENDDNYGFYQIGDKDSPALDGMPPIKFTLKNKQEYILGTRGYLSYDCNIKKFRFPLNVDEFEMVRISRCENISESEFQRILKMINDAKSIKYVSLRAKVNSNKIINGEGFKLFKRNFEGIYIYPEIYNNIEFDQNVYINNIDFLKDDKKLNNHPKIITLPICRNIHFSKIYTYNEIEEMLSDYIHNPNIRKINITTVDKLSSHETENIKNIILSKK